MSLIGLHRSLFRRQLRRTIESGGQAGGTEKQANIDFRSHGQPVAELGKRSAKGGIPYSPTSQKRCRLPRTHSKKKGK